MPAASRTCLLLVCAKPAARLVLCSICAVLSACGTTQNTKTTPDSAVEQSSLPTATRTGTASVLARSYTFRASSGDEAVAFSSKVAILAESDAGLGGSYREQLRRAGMVGAVVDAESINTILRDAAATERTPMRASDDRTMIGAQSQLIIPTGPRWVPLQSGQSAARWSLALGGSIESLPGGETRLLGRAWPSPGDALPQGDFAATMTLDLLPVIYRPPSASRLALDSTSPQNASDLPLQSCRLTLPLKRGQVLMLAPLLNRRAPVVIEEDPSESLRAGEVVRTSAKPAASTPPPAKSPATPTPKGPAAESPLSLGEALLTDAQPLRPAREFVVIVLVPTLPGAYAILPDLSSPSAPR